MALDIEKRVKVDIDSEWGEWASTSDTPPYTNTELIEYRVADSAELNIDEIYIANSMYILGI